VTMATDISLSGQDSVCCHKTQHVSQISLTFLVMRGRNEQKIKTQTFTSRGDFAVMRHCRNIFDMNRADPAGSAYGHRQLVLVQPR
jgi:hypothetical protein